MSDPLPKDTLTGMTRKQSDEFVTKVLKDMGHIARQCDLDHAWQLSQDIALDLKVNKQHLTIFMQALIEQGIERAIQANATALEQATRSSEITTADQIMMAYHYTQYMSHRHMHLNGCAPVDPAYCPPARSPVIQAINPADLDSFLKAAGIKSPRPN